MITTDYLAEVFGENVSTHVALLKLLFLIFSHVTAHIHVLNIYILTLFCYLDRNLSTVKVLIKPMARLWRSLKRSWRLHTLFV